MNLLLKTLAKIVLIPLVGLMQFAGYNVQPTIPQTPLQTFGSTIPVTSAVFETSLASNISSTDTSMTLANGTDQAGHVLTGYTCFAVDSGQSNNEFICGTAAGTSITSLIRGIDTLTGTTTVAALQFSHRRGADVKITDYPVLGILARILNGADTIPNPLTYYTHPCSGSSSSTTVCDKNYIDNQVIAGGVVGSNSVAGIYLLATALQNASSTGTGVYNTTTYSNVISSGLSTSSPTVSCVKGCIPATRDDGKISPLFFGTTTADTYNFNGTVTSSGITTLSGQNNTIASSTQFTTNVGTLNATSSITLNGTAVNTAYLLKSAYIGAAASTGATSTAYTLPIPANTLKTTNHLVVKAFFNSVTTNGTNTGCDIGFGSGAATTSIAYAGGGGVGFMENTYLEANIFATTTLGQLTSSRGAFNANSVSSFSRNNNTPYNIGNTLYLDFKCADDTGGIMQLSNLIVQVIQ